jgi:hypothetical protein
MQQWWCSGSNSSSHDKRTSSSSSRSSNDSKAPNCNVMLAQVRAFGCAGVGAEGYSPVVECKCGLRKWSGASGLARLRYASAPLRRLRY